MNDSVLFISLSCHPEQHGMFYMWSCGGWWLTVHCSLAPTIFKYYHLAGQLEPYILSSIFILSNIFLTKEGLALLRKIYIPYNKFYLTMRPALKDSSIYFLKLQKTGSKSGFHRIVTTRIGKELSSLLSTSSVPSILLSSVGICGMRKRSRTLESYLGPDFSFGHLLHVKLKLKTCCLTLLLVARKKINK